MQKDVSTPSILGMDVKGGRIHPCIIRPARYGGTYSGARWHAWGLRPEEIPHEAYGSDIECARFWALASPETGIDGLREEYANPQHKKYRRVVGLGTTPDEALESLREKVKQYDES